MCAHVGSCETPHPSTAWSVQCVSRVHVCPFGLCVCVCSRGQILGDLLPAMVRLSTDEQDSVRLLSVTCSVKLCAVVGAAAKTSQVRARARDLVCV